MLVKSRKLVECVGKLKIGDSTVFVEKWNPDQQKVENYLSLIFLIISSTVDLIFGSLFIFFSICFIAYTIVE